MIEITLIYQVFFVFLIPGRNLDNPATSCLPEDFALVLPQLRPAYSHFLQGSGLRSSHDCAANTKQPEELGQQRTEGVLRQPLHHPRQGLRKVIVNDHRGEQYQEDKSRLIDTLFDLQADVASDDALNKQQ